MINCREVTRKYEYVEELMENLGHFSEVSMRTHLGVDYSLPSS